MNVIRHVTASELATRNLKLRGLGEDDVIHVSGQTSPLTLLPVHRKQNKRWVTLYTVACLSSLLSSLLCLFPCSMFSFVLGLFHFLLLICSLYCRHAASFRLGLCATRADAHVPIAVCVCVCVCDMFVVVAAIWTQIDPSSTKSARISECWDHGHYDPSHKHVCVLNLVCYWSSAKIYGTASCAHQCPRY